MFASTAVFLPGPGQFSILASWNNRERQADIDYLRNENKVLREQVGKRRIQLGVDRLTDNNTNRPQLRSMFR